MGVQETLEIDKLKERFLQHACTRQAKEKINGLVPLLSETEVRRAQRETTEAKTIIEHLGNPPLTDFDQVEPYLAAAEKGSCLLADQLEHIGGVLAAVKRLKAYLNKSKYLEISLSYDEENLNPLEDLQEEIRRSVRNGKVDDFASKELTSLRRQIEQLKAKMREKADSLLKSKKQYMADNFSTTRNGRICLPVKKEYKFQIPGSVIDKSATGSTLFIEPAAVAKYGEELWLKTIAEENEVQRILYTLTAMIADRQADFCQNQKIFARLDFAFAKAKLSLAYGGAEPEITTRREIRLVSVRHPLMDRETCVPLSFNLGGDIRGIIITGPNTGGKTVAIKTVGMNCYMAQCGLHIAGQKGLVCLNNQILCDIGDGQNLAENLSTFSAHITHVLEILGRADKDSLVILDELGSGTDPTEGMGIAIAILDQLRKTNALFLVTTHYLEVKNYGENTSGVVNARMTFDRESLKPRFQLEIGKAGDSCALYIAKKLGMPEEMLVCAGRAAYGEEHVKGAFRDFLQDAVKGGIKPASSPHLKKQLTVKEKQAAANRFKLGDSVMVYPDQKIGIVCLTANDKGVLRVQMPDKKIWVNHKRIKLHVAAAELYPPDYDFSIIFDTVENRKLRHQMGKRHEASVQIECDE